MRSFLIVVAVVISLGFVGTPASAQLRTDIPGQAPVKVVETGMPFSLNRLFSPEIFQMRHSYSLGMSSFGGMGLTMGEYTNSMSWTFSPKLAARLDVAFAHTPLGTGSAAPLFGGQDRYGKLYLKNAEVLYRPTERTSLYLSVRQSPYGPYMSPYGYYDPYGYGYGGYGYDYGMYGSPYGFYRPYGSRGFMGELSWN